MMAIFNVLWGCNEGTSSRGIKEVESTGLGDQTDKGHEEEGVAMMIPRFLIWTAGYMSLSS